MGCLKSLVVQNQKNAIPPRDNLSVLLLFVRRHWSAVLYCFEVMNLVLAKPDFSGFVFQLLKIARRDVVDLLPTRSFLERHGCPAHRAIEFFLVGVILGCPAPPSLFHRP